MTPDINVVVAAIHCGIWPPGDDRQGRCAMNAMNDVAEARATALSLRASAKACHECEFDASDAVAAIIVRVEQTIETLDRLCLEASQ